MLNFAIPYVTTVHSEGYDAQAQATVGMVQEWLIQGDTAEGVRESVSLAEKWTQPHKCSMVMNNLRD